MAYTAEQFLGKIGVSKGIFTQKELSDCYRIQRERHRKSGNREPLSYILLEKKLITREQMYKLLQEFKYSCLRRDDKKIAEIIKDRGFLTEDEVEIALKFQRKLFRNGVGLFQLGEILISKDILDEEKVYEILCEFWLQRNPGKELPEHAKPQKLVEIGEKSNISSATKMQVEKIHESEGKSGYKVCDVCGFENSLDAMYCHSCSERLAKYTFKVKSDEGNITLFKKSMNEDENSNEVYDLIECKECGFHNPISAEICFKCFRPLPDAPRKKKHIITELSRSDELEEETSVRLKDLPESLDYQEVSSIAGIVYKSQESPHFLIEHKKKEIVDGSITDRFSIEDYTNSNDTLVYETLIYDPNSSKLFIPTVSEAKNTKKCPKCGYVNENIMLFCFACHELFDDCNPSNQPNVRVVK